MKHRSPKTSTGVGRASTAYAAARAGLQRGTGGGRKIAGTGAGNREMDEDHGAREADLIPTFDELSRWRVVLGPVPRMAKLVGEVCVVYVSFLFSFGVLGGGESFFSLFNGWGFSGGREGASSLQRRLAKRLP